jgi:L-amino acid N-acyltransferase YncA
MEALGMRIRLAETRDGGAVAGIYRPHVAEGVASFEEEPPSAEEMGQRIHHYLAHAPWLCCEEEGTVLGYAYASRHHDRAAYRWCVDVSVYVAGDARRRGVGRALYRSLFALLRLQGIRAAHAGITLPNAASVGIHEALGFRPVAVYPRVGWKRGAWHDVGWWQLELLPREGEPPPEPLDMEALRRAPGFEAALAAGLRGAAG